MIRFDTGEPEQRERGLAAAAAALRRGQLVGLPLDTTYGVAVDAFAAGATQSLADAKGRAALSVPVMVPRIATVPGIAVVEDAAARLMRDFWPGALTLILPAQPTLAWSLTDAAGRVAVRMPLHPLALELLERTGPLGVVAAAYARDPRAPVTATASFPPDLAAHLAVLLDAGAVPAGASSAVLDLTGAQPRLIRAGPLAISDLRACCPDLLVAPSAEPPVPGT